MVDAPVIETAIRDIDSRISEQINVILHHKQFQELESAWRGLKFLVDRVDFDSNIKLEILNVSKKDLISDFGGVSEPYLSGLFKHLYKDEYDCPGGEPIGAIIANYEILNEPQDIGLLSSVSNVAASCHAPFIASVGSEFFGLRSLEELRQVRSIAPLFENPKFTKWKAFRDTEDSRYVGLTIPRFLLRPPYESPHPSYQDYRFVEEVSNETLLWGNTSIAFASCLTRSFTKHGLCVNICGPQTGGVVEDLTLHNCQWAGKTVTMIPTEAPFDGLGQDTLELQLVEQGFIPLFYYKNWDYACFFSARSCQKPKQYIDNDATANSRLSANLPYLFLVSRLSHYLKVIHTHNIGFAEKEYLQFELEEWLNQYVIEDASPSPAAKTKYPLSMGSIKVTDPADNPYFYNVEMLVRPHFKVEGVEVTLSLVSRFPKDSRAYGFGGEGGLE